MEALDRVMRSIVDNTEDAIGCAVASMETGDLLGVAHNVNYFDKTYLDAVAEAAVAMFRGDTVRHVEELISAYRGVPAERLLEEVQMTTRHTIHFMMVLPNHPEAVVVLITNRQCAIGIGWATVRQSSLEIEPILDDPQAA
jgi:hypothetical protein